jgi:hypothetical protein
MDIVRAAILRSSPVFTLDPSSEQSANLVFGASGHIEDMQALALLNSIFSWHGSQQQRQQGREEFWRLAESVHRTALMQPLPYEHPQFSALHQPGPVTGEEVNTWSWSSWVENEKRVRLMAFILLYDASTTIFFNTPPQIDVYDVKIPLPADDAAWEADTAESCASALGLRGEGAQFKNESGSRRAKQLGIAEAMQVLYGAGHGHFPQRATNVFGKFSKSTTRNCLPEVVLIRLPVLIHAIHSQIYNIQRQLLRRVPKNGTSTPRGPATPPNGVNEQTQSLLRSTVNALELWKQCWDADLAIQFTQHQRRHGFCRDGIHFYFLARLFLRSSRPQEWAAPADLRCRQVFHLLKQIRAHVALDSAQKGIDLGSINTIADDYAIADLTLNMKRLFTPLEGQ